MEEDNEGRKQKSGNSVSNIAKEKGKEVVKEKAKEEIKKKAAKETAKKAATKTATKLAAKSSLMAALGPILVWAAIIIVAIIILVGIIMFFMTVPGMVMDKLKSFTTDLAKSLASFYGADSTAMISDEEKYEVLDYLEQMGYDLKGYGFISENVDSSDPNYDEKQGVIRDPDTGKIKEARTDIIGMYIMSDNYVYTVKNFNEVGLLAFLKSLYKTAYPIIGIALDNLIDGTQWGKGLISIHFEDGRAYEKNIVDQRFGTNTSYNNIKIDPEAKTMDIRRGWGSNYYSYKLDGWTGRYGMPLDFLLSLHIATMKPDLTYEMIAKFDTNVDMRLKKIGSGDAEVVASYKIQSGGFVTFPQIEKALTGNEGRHWYSATWDWFDDLVIAEDEAKAVFALGVEHAESCDCPKNDSGDLTGVGSNCKQHIKDILSELKNTNDYHFETYIPYIKKVENHWFRDVYFELDSDEAQKVQLSRTDLDYEKKTNERWTKYEIYEDGKNAGEYKLYKYDENAQNGIGELYSGTQADADKDGIKVVKKPVETYAKNLADEDIITLKDDGSWSAYKDEDTSASDYKKVYPDSEQDPIKSKIYYKDSINSNKVQKEDGVRGITNATIKDMFLNRNYFTYDGTSKTADIIEQLRSDLGMKYGEIPESKLDNEYTVQYKTEKGTTESETVKVKDYASKVSITQDSLAAFSMLENTHTLDADYIYKDFKELIVELGYFKKEELSDGRARLLEFLVPDIGSGGYPKRVLDKKENEYGTELHSKEDYEANEKNTLQNEMNQPEKTDEEKKKEQDVKVTVYENKTKDGLSSVKVNIKEKEEIVANANKNFEDLKQKANTASEDEKEEINKEIEKAEKELEDAKQELSIANEKVNKYEEINDNIKKYKEIDEKLSNSGISEEERKSLKEDQKSLSEKISHDYNAMQELDYTPQNNGQKPTSQEIDRKGRGNRIIDSDDVYEDSNDLQGTGSGSLATTQGILQANEQKLGNSVGNLNMNVYSDLSKLQSIGGVRTEKDPSEVSLAEFLQAAKDVHKVCEDLKFEYCWGVGNKHNSDWGHTCAGLYNTLEDARNAALHRIDCSTFVSYVLQAVGLMEGRDYTGTLSGNDGFYGLFKEYILDINEAGELQEGDITLSSKHIQINGEKADGGFIQYNAGTGEAIRGVPSVGEHSSATHVIRLPFNGNGLGEGGTYEGYEGNEAVVSPVTGILLDYGTYDKNKEEDDGYRKNSDKNENVDEVGYAKILVLNEEISDQLVTCTDEKHKKEVEKDGNTISAGKVTVEAPQNTDKLNELSDMEKALYGYSIFAEDYENGKIAGYVVYIDGFKCELPTANADSDDEENNSSESATTLTKEYLEQNASSGDGDGDFKLGEYAETKYKPDKVYKLTSETLEEKQKAKAEAKSIAAPLYKFTGSLNGETKEMLLIKEGTVIGRTLTNKELVEEIRQQTYVEKNDESEEDTENDRDVEGNYLRIIMRDLDDTVVENVEDYMKLDEGGKNSANVSLDDDKFLYWLGVYIEGGELDSTGKISKPKDLNDGIGWTHYFGLTKSETELAKKLGYDIDWGSDIELQKLLDIFLALVEEEKAYIKQELGDDIPDGYLQAFISVKHNYGNLTSRGKEYKQNKKVSEETWTTYNGNYAETLRKRRKAEWALITEGKYLKCYDDNSELEFTSETPFADWCKEHGLTLSN